ncbi:MAG: hypothetical protein GW947_02475 [Candidatus Pacebacteria bacterium]|nr:hypothetical protein [Candidatus Paceibacterota bacterium]PIR61012.1 MAG: hypothetical protein COU68_01665 [Candidatus Pacebacteria bacterium CG10_big_fil_rev_8_21_14_0_10_45_6]
MKRFLLFVFAAATFFSLFHLYYNSQFPYTHDGENHLARFANYKIALREGQIPPRFAPNLMNHYGYPVFNYNYPLANILSLPFSFIGVSYETTFELLVVISVLFGAGGVWQLTKTLKASPNVRWLSVIVWLLQPYLVSTIYFRGNIGEILALSLLPWLVWLPYSLAAKKKITFRSSHTLFGVGILTAFLLSHNISAVVGSGIYIVLCLALFYRSKQKLLASLAVVIWAIGLSLWFWLPALAEMSSVVVGDASLVSEFSAHFVTLSQLLWSPLRFGFSYLGGVDSLSFAIGLPAILVLLGVGTSLLIRQRLAQAGPFLLLFVLACLTVVGQLSLSKSLWELVPALHFLQFPWRLSLFTVTLLLPSLVFLLGQSKLILRLLVVLLLFQVISLLRLSPIDYFHKTNLDYAVFSQSTSTQNENRTKEFTYADIGDWQPRPTLLQPDAGIITVQSWNGSKRKYTLLLTTETTIIEPTMNFPGWETTVLQDGVNKTVSYIHNDVSAGRIAYELPAGSYQVMTLFTQNTPARLIGNAVSLISFGVLIFAMRKPRG